MNKEEAVVEFLKGLRVAIHNSLAYQPEHPYFLKSTENFKSKVDDLLEFLNPIKVNVTPDSLFLEAKTRQKDVFSLELAQILHARKVKSLEFRLGLSSLELVTFLSLISLHPNEIMKRNGLCSMLEGRGVEHIHIEELDYSQLLGNKGECAKDIWAYLFKDNLSQQDPGQMAELVDSFLEGAPSLSAKKIIEDDELRHNLCNFLTHLKNTRNEKFSECVQQLSKPILDSGSQISGEHISKLKEVFAELKDKDFADILFSQITDKKPLNLVNFELFSQLAGRERLENIPSLLDDNKGSSKNNPALMRKVQEVLSAPDSGNISPAYRNALSALVKNVKFKGSFSFDRSLLKNNYRMILLTLFNGEKSKEVLELISGRLRTDWEKKSPEEDYHFLKLLFDSATSKKSAGDLSEEDFVNIEKWIAGFAEGEMWIELNNPDHLYLLDSIQNTYIPDGTYLDKIFRQDQCSLLGLRRFLKFYPQEKEAFYSRLKERCVDLEFMNQLIKILIQLNSPVSLDALKRIFSFGNNVLKDVTLKAMQRIDAFDPEFLFPVLTDMSATLRKEALAVLIKDPVAVRKGIDIFLNIPSPWGSRNRLISENMGIVEGLKLKDARDYLVRLSQRRFFWNSEIRKKAMRILRSWND